MSVKTIDAYSRAVRRKTGSLWLAVFYQHVLQRDWQWVNIQ